VARVQQRAQIEALGSQLSVPRANGVDAQTIDRPDTETPVESIDRSALQELLAFSALHQQIQTFRLRQPRSADGLGQEASDQPQEFGLDAVLQLVVQRALTITGADGIAIALAKENTIVCRASAGNIAPDHGISVDANSRFSGTCLLSGRIVRCDDTELDARVNRLICRSLGARSIVAVPLAAKRQVIGLIEAFSAKSYKFNDGDVRALSLIAELTVAAMKPEKEDRLAEVPRNLSKHEEHTASRQAPSRENADRRETANEKPRVAGTRLLPSGSRTSDNQRPGLGVVVAIIIFASTFGVALWWRMRASDSRAAVQSTIASDAHSRGHFPQNTSTVAPSNHEPKLTSDESYRKSATEIQVLGFPRVIAIRHWSSPDSSTVAIGLEGRVQYEAHRLSSPERIYFDLHDTGLVSELSNKEIRIGGPLIRRVRVAQPIPGTTRIVLDVLGTPHFSVSLETKPYRLIIQVRKIT
jgi:GAF domain/AMIN domain